MAPRLNRKMVLEAPVRVPDQAGGYTVVWQALGEVWGAVKASTGRETASDAITLARVPVRITLRAAPAGSSKRPEVDQRLVEGRDIYMITGVADDVVDRRYLTCFALLELVA